MAFKDDLIDELLSKPGEIIEIEHLRKKYCPHDDFFDPNVQNSLMSCRLNLNRTLSEFYNLKWIDLYPTSGFSAATAYDGNAKKRYFLSEGATKVRLTTFGEIELKKIKHLPITNQANIGTFTGVFLQGSSISDTDFTPEIKPIINPVIVPTTEAKKQGIITSIGKFLIKNITAIIISVIAAVLAGYILWRLDWLN